MLPNHQPAQTHLQPGQNPGRGVLQVVDEHDDHRVGAHRARGRVVQVEGAGPGLNSLFWSTLTSTHLHGQPKRGHAFVQLAVGLEHLRVVQGEAVVEGDVAGEAVAAQLELDDRHLGARDDARVEAVPAHERVHGTQKLHAHRLVT